MMLKVLAVTDEVDPRIYSTSLRDRMGGVDLVISCGDLPASYLEYLADALHRDVYYVLGNHAEELVREGQRGEIRHPLGGTDLGFKIVTDKRTGVIFAGLPGSPRYSEFAPVQYTEWQLTRRILRMAPRLLWNKMRHGRAMDILVTHSPSRDVGDREDPAHRGFKVMRRLIKWARPAFHLHGHVHLYDRNEGHVHTLYDTEVINVYPFRRLDLELAHLPDAEPFHDSNTESLRAELSPDTAEGS